MYRLIAFDMDGTLLNDRKEIGARTKAAIERAAGAGKCVAYCTGRALMEIEEFIAQVPAMRYAVLNNGAALWDLKERKKLLKLTLEPGLVGQVLELVGPEEYLIQTYRDAMEYSDLSAERLTACGMGQYREGYFRMGVRIVPELGRLLRQPHEPLEKLALHFPGQAARLAAKARIEAAGLPVNINFGNRYSLEFTTPGCTKALGLRRLAELLNVPMSEVIAVGDSENDNEAVALAGLGIAMANGTEELKGLADVITEADNNHDGCAEAIERYLLGTEQTRKREKP